VAGGELGACPHVDDARRVAAIDEIEKARRRDGAGAGDRHGHMPLK
jgi:hypothetical protein